MAVTDHGLTLRLLARFRVLGGHVRIVNDRPVLFSADTPELAALRLQLESRLEGVNAILRTSGDGGAAKDVSTQDWPMHAAQKGLWQARIARQTGANCAFAYRVVGALDAERLLAAYRLCLARYDALRLIGLENAGSMHWRMGTIPRVSLIKADAPVDALDPNALHSRIAIRFDPMQGELARIEILRCGEADWLIIEAFDHMIADGRSLALLHADLERAYHGEEPGEPPGSYAALLNEAARSARHGHSEAFWRQAYSGFDEQARGFGGSTHAPAVCAHLHLSADDLVQIDQSVAGLGITMAGLLFAAHAHAMARFMGKGDIACSLVMDGRSIDDRHTFGQVTHLAPIRVTHDWSRPLRAHLAALARQLLATREHLGIDPDGLDRCGAPVDLNGPEAGVFVFQDRPARPPQLGEATVQSLALPDLHEAGGVVCVVHQHDNGIALHWRAPGTSHVARHLSAFPDSIQAFLAALHQSETISLGSDAMLSEKQRRAIEASAVASPSYRAKSVAPDILRALRNRDAVILETAQGIHKASALRKAVAERLCRLRHLHVAKRRCILVAEADPFARIASFLAVLRYGGIYVPLDPTAPTAQNTQLAHRCGAVACFGESGLTILEHGPDPLQAAPWLARPSLVSNGLAPTDLNAGEADPAYVIFTSGTTGRPKGVVVHHAALSNLARGEATRFDITSSSRVLLIAPPTFDPWICHVTGALLAGATLVAMPVLDDVSLGMRMEEKRISHAFLPSSLFAQLEASAYPALRLIATAGDHCRLEDVARLRTPGRRIVNIYGPTEATVTASLAEMTDRVSDAPIGTPIKGLGLRVLIDGAASAPPGVLGELAIVGCGVALGYLDDETATSACFGPDPFVKGQRLYRTGDIGWLGADGLFRMRGRSDRQVKIRGFRIELDAIEHAARETGLCSDAHALVETLTDDHKRLLLFAEACKDADRLMRSLRETLSMHHVPQRILAIEELPRNASGKTDEKRLLDIHATMQVDDAAPATGQDESARILARIWRRHLGFAPKDHDDVFSHGGDSLSILRMVRDLRIEDLMLSPGDIYRNPIFADLARLIHQQAQRLTDSGSPASSAPLLPSQAWFFSLDLENPWRWNQQHRLHLVPMPSPETLKNALKRLIEITPILRAVILRDGVTLEGEYDDDVLSCLPADVPDDSMAAALEALQSSFDPAQGRLLRGLALYQENSEGLLLLAAHHLAVDEWSWTVIEDRLRSILALPTQSIPRDEGYARAAQAIQTQITQDAFAFDVPGWASLLATEPSSRNHHQPGPLTQLAATMTGDPRALAKAWSIPVSAVLLGCLGAAFERIEPGATILIDLERNARACLPALDLTTSVGWFSLHHPLPLHAVPFSEAACRNIARMLDAIPDQGLGYGVLRWQMQALPDVPMPRFAVNLSDFTGRMATTPDQPLYDRLARLAAPTTDARNRLPYVASLVFRPSMAGYRIEIGFDAAALPAQHAQIMIEAIVTAAVDPRQDGIGTPPDHGLKAFETPFPASAMQSLMLTAAGQGPGIYRPRQILSISRPSGGSAAFLDRLAETLMHLPPLRLRFGQEARSLVQYECDERPRITRIDGDRAMAMAWMQRPNTALDPDAVLADAVLAGSAPYALSAFVNPDTDDLCLAMQMHHAIIDGHSHETLLALIGAVASNDAAAIATLLRQAGGTRGLRRHVAAERAAWREAGLAQGSIPITQLRDRPDRTAIDPHETVLDARTVAALLEWSARRGFDQRSAYAGAALALTHQLDPGAFAFLVSNGRDPDRPEMQDAMGLFWFFMPLMAESDQVETLAAQVFAQADAPQSRLRLQTWNWPDWLDGRGLSFNFVKEPLALPREKGGLSVLASDDLFHFDRQIAVTLLRDGRARIGHGSFCGNAEQQAKLYLSILQTML